MCSTVHFFFQGGKYYTKQYGNPNPTKTKDRGQREEGTKEGQSKKGTKQENKGAKSKVGSKQGVREREMLRQSKDVSMGGTSVG